MWQRDLPWTQKGAPGSTLRGFCLNKALGGHRVVNYSLQDHLCPAPTRSLHLHGPFPNKAHTILILKVLKLEKMLMRPELIGDHGRFPTHPLVSLLLLSQLGPPPPWLRPLW